MDLGYDCSGLPGIALARSPPCPRLSHSRQLPEVIRSARCSRGRAALVPHDRSSGLACLFQQIIGERTGSAQKLAASRGSVLGKGFCRGDEKIGFGQQILEGL